MDFSLSIEIVASPDRVWAVMSDIERWSEWTASVKGIKKFGTGALAPGTWALVRQPKFPPALWKVTAVGERSFTWESRAPGLHVVARHSVEPMPTGSRATLSLRYTGVLGQMLGGLTRALTDRYLQLEAEGLKRRSEAPEAA